MDNDDNPDKNKSLIDILLDVNEFADGGKVVRCFLAGKKK